MTDQNVDPDALTPEEEAYFTNHGEAAEREEPTPEVEGEAEEVVTEEAEGESEGDGEEEGGEKKASMVPHSALHAERMKRKELDQKVRDYETQLQTLKIVEDRFKRFEQAQAEQKPAEVEQIPDKNEDPLGYIDYMDRKLGTLTQQQQQMMQARQQEEQMRQFQQSISAEEAQFAQETPDYQNAAAFVRDAIARDLQAMGYPPQQINDQLRAQLMNIAISAKEARRSVPEVVYTLAQQRGYAAPSDKKDDSKAAEETLKKVAEGQKANKTIGNGGGAAAGKMTLEKFAAMSEAESMAWLDRNPEGYQRLFGQ